MCVSTPLIRIVGKKVCFFFFLQRAVPLDWFRTANSVKVAVCFLSSFFFFVLCLFSSPVMYTF